MTLTLIPVSVCSWDFRADGATSGPAYLRYRWVSEQGSLSCAGAEFDVRKAGLFTARWAVERNGERYAEAVKPSAFYRKFEIQASGIALDLDAESAFTRSYRLHSNGRQLGVIRPAHAFTRRAMVDCAPEVPELIQLFAFWLVALTWRRQQGASSGG